MAEEVLSYGSSLTLIVSATLLLLSLNNHPFPNEISSVGHFWAQALIVFGWIFLSTALVILYSTLQQQSSALLQAQGQKIDDLFRVLFHDLANPLGRIAIGLTIARRDLKDGEANRGIDIATAASESMLEITQNIRKMYAVSKGKAEVDLVPTSLHSAVVYVLDLYSSEIEKKQLKINFDKTTHAELKLLVDPISFKNQVLGNILSNAIKFSPENSEISISVHPDENNFYRVEIKDNGIGIPDELMKSLFDIKMKTNRPGTQGELGSGFGMHIMRSFVEMYGGDLQIESTVSSKPFAGTIVKLFLRGE